MVKRTLFVALLTLLFSATAQALTVDDVIYMSSAGVDDSIIIAKIEASGDVYDLSTEEIVGLWEAGVSPDVIEYMISTASGDVEAYDEEEAEYEGDDDVDEIIIRHPRSRVHLYFGWGYYDSWYYPYWWAYRPYNYDWYFYTGFYWPYYYWPDYYYWSPYAYYYPWDCWGWRHGRNVAHRPGFRHQWRRGGLASADHGGRSGYRLKPAYDVGAGGKGGYLARDGRYVFPKGESRDGYLGVHRGSRKPLATKGYGSKGSSGGYYDRGKYYGSKSRYPERRLKDPRTTYKKGTRTKYKQGARSTYKKGTRTSPKKGTPTTVKRGRVQRKKSSTTGRSYRSGQKGTTRSQGKAGRSGYSRPRSSGSSGGRKSVNSSRSGSQQRSGSRASSGSRSSGGRSGGRSSGGRRK